MSAKPAKAWQVVDKQTKVVLVTAFEPFGDSDVNASETVLRQLEQTLDDIRTGVLPVRKSSVHKTLAGLIEQHNPDVLIMLGEAGPKEEIRMELVALNHDDFRMPDNDGLTVEACKIVDSGPDAYFSNINVHSVAGNLPTDDGYAPSTISLSAGSFLCNHTYFLARHFHGNLPAVFVHIPCLRDETHPPSAFERVSNTVNCIVREITATLATSTTD